ncbi:IMS domain-containing protein [Geminocystis herdmanii]|uniref:IMS domain-containing protein n=1 Tax=Geminocystis herdmanii TaxID=669359 RepID=UPI000347DC3A|nr:IMS domain-containing protein [Geminocystis herdmanii]
MEISLDYYRILGVPVQADSDLIEQAYHDRIIQLPHKGYTEYAINSRKNIIQQAYDVLSQEESRLEYESSFLASPLERETLDAEDFSTEDSEVFSDTNIDIEESLFVGALIVLLDLGEYELVISLIQPYLLERTPLNIFTEKEEEIPLIFQDLVLTIVLAYLELATEQWQEKQYESASNSLKKSYELLFKEDLFSDLRKEIKQDLGKLLPYEILELLTRENSLISEREKAINSLKSMLKARGGIESKKVDDSGLDIDSFLKFIQQIRVYLTAEEQQNIFEEEAKRPSPAGGYLAAYAGIARGFTERKPEFIIRAKNSLISLTIHQDVYLEQSICALLLGQTAEAEFSLSQSREKQVISYIQEMSQDSPDLLPGLCIYTEKWLQTEVFPQFKNLSKTNPSLQDYFADDRVQTYLEKINLPLSPELPENESSLELELPLTEKKDSSYSFSQFNALKEQTDYEEQIINQTYSENHSSNVEIDTSESTLEIENLSLLVENNPSENEDDLVGLDDFLSSEVEQEKVHHNNMLVIEKEIPLPKVSSSADTDLDKDNNNQFLIIASVILLLLFGSIGVFASRMLFKGETEIIKLEISLSEPLIELPSLTPPPMETGKLNNDTALEIINQWLKAKVNATGPEYNTSELSKILTEPLLSKWVGNSRDLRSRNAYRRYEHKVSIESAEVNPQDETQGVITAKVEEKSQYYRNGALVPSLSYQDNLSLTYDVIKNGNQWLIKDVKIRN